MRKNTKYLLLCSCIFLLTGLLGGCTKEVVAPINTIPLINFKSVSATTLVQFKDSLVITFEYTDGDGDIGEENPDKNDLQIKDSRLSKPDFYFVKPLAPPGSSINIKGTIAVQMKNTFLLGTANSEITTFELRLRDRAGNWSNSIVTPVITITK